MVSLEYIQMLRDMSENVYYGNVRFLLFLQTHYLIVDVPNNGSKAG